MEVAKYDLLVRISGSGQELRLEWTYKTSLFNHSTLVAMSAYLETLLDCFYRRPEMQLDDLPKPGDDADA